MRKKSAAICLLLAWLCANGAVSDVAQIFAWGRMFASYARALPISEALSETFDAGKPCDLCVTVKQTRERDDALPRAATLASERIFLACTMPEMPEVFVPPNRMWPIAADWSAVARIESVPIRPPRV